MTPHTAVTAPVAHTPDSANRDDPVLNGTGGPAGNTRLTAWTGLVLLGLSIAETLTLLNLRGLISWHIIIGVLLVPPALVKTGTTGWRIVRYYTGNAPYRTAGPPPMALRILGPVVVISTLGVLATGTAAALMNPTTAGKDLSPLGLSLLNVHKVLALIWIGATALHVLGRLATALRHTIIPTVARTIPGRTARMATLGITLAIAAIASVAVLAAATPWRTPHPSAPTDRTSHAQTR